MGNFRIVINAVGGHGVDREVKEGEVVNHFAEGLQTPDAMAKLFVTFLQANGISPDSAELIHWPGEDSEVIDDLISSVRKGNF
jgi:hypothetical protein